MSATGAAAPAGHDPGRAQERTTLAWRRTGLALLIGAVTVSRLALDHLGPLVVVPGALTAATALWVVARGAGARRPVGATGAATPTGDGPAFSLLRDGRMPAVVAATLAALALGELLTALGALV